MTLRHDTGRAGAAGSPLTAVLLLLAVSACANEWHPERGKAAAARAPAASASAAALDSPAVDSSAAAFGVRLFRAIAERDPASNVFISPLSAAQAVAMVHDGAAGRTREEIAAVLALPGSAGTSDIGALAKSLTGQDDVTLRVANSLWSRDGAPVRREYAEQVRRRYAAEIASLDLGSRAAVDRINAWVSRATSGKILTMLEAPLPTEAAVVLLNAVYFKGTWRDEFEPAATTDRPFHLASGRTESRAMMARVGSYAYLQREGMQLVRLPYRGDRFAMYILLPDTSSSLAAMYGVMDARTLAAWLDSARATEVSVVLPRFTLAYGVELNEPLQSLGMRSAFDARDADLSGILSPEQLGGRHSFIYRTRQKVFIDVNEEGTEAAAVTSIEVGVDSAGPVPILFVADRPFFAAIRDDRTGALLFMGQVTDPGAPHP